MSYDPSPYTPPPQGRWPQATPPVPWPSYRDGDLYRDGDVYRNGDLYRNGADYRDEERLDGQYAANPQRAYPVPAGYQHQHGYQDQPGYQRTSGGYEGTGGYPATEYGQTRTGYAWGEREGYAWDAQPEYPQPEYPQDGYGYGYAPGSHPGGDGYISDGFDGAQHDFTGPVRYPDWDSYPEPVPPLPTGEMLTAPDLDLHPDSWQLEQDRRRAAARRGLAVGAFTGLLTVAVAIGVSTLAAAFVQPQAAPAITFGDMFIDHVPAGLRSMAITHFGSHGRTVLLLGMYLAIACLALATGALSRRAPALGVASLAVFTLFGALVSVTRPQGRMSDAVPALIGGVAAAVALLWLRRASAPVTPRRPAAPRQPSRQSAHGGSRRSR